jgi:putative ATP-dependent endonuclease of OLD family
MRISRIEIENFRSIKKLDLELGETTVLIGPNNAGKTSVLDALRIALTRRWGQKGTGFTEYDVHLESEGADPKASPGIRIEVRVEEAAPGEWPEAVQQDLDDVVQVDPETGRSSVNLQVTCAWNTADEGFTPTWAFLNAARKPLMGGSARRTNLERFWQYLPIFYLGALRDAADEFSARSQFWGKLLKAVQVPANLEARTQRLLNLLNKKLLVADPKLGRIADTLSGATRVAAQDGDGGVDLRLLPLKSWDLLSKAEIILRNEETCPWLPLKHHGQGMQSLSVLFLFQSFVEHLLAELYEPDSTPVLALEEPETHLHPQAARALWSHVSRMPGQKIVSTHSPFFVQNVPFRDLRLLRLTDTGTQVTWLPASFSTVIPTAPGLDDVVAGSGGMLQYAAASNVLTVNGQLDEALFRRLLTCFGGHAQRADAEPALRDLKERSKLHISDDELRGLETYARRIRGEIFFARRWLIVEGQAEYLLVHGLARALGYPLDDHGVAVIDAQNNGSPQTFAALARALCIPWLAVFDGDDAGKGYVESILARNFDATFVAERCKVLTAGNLEHQLISDGLGKDLRDVLVDLGKPSAAHCDENALLKLLESSKTDYSALLARRMDAALAARMPQAFRTSIEALRGLT